MWIVHELLPSSFVHCYWWRSLSQGCFGWKEIFVKWWLTKKGLSSEWKPTIWWWWQSHHQGFGLTSYSKVVNHNWLRDKQNQLASLMSNRGSKNYGYLRGTHLSCCSCIFLKTRFYYLTTLCYTHYWGRNCPSSC